MFHVDRRAGALARIAFLAAFLAVGLGLVRPGGARADSMDLALERLRIPEGVSSCSSAQPCANNEAFERLVSELAVTVAPTVSGGAATLGPAGFYLGVSSTVTPIPASRLHWRSGTEGDGRDSPNASPDGALVWNRFSLRKGLPFGFEAGVAAGQAIDTSMWTLGAELRWALLEGFHSGLGNFPDLAVRGVLASTVGARSLALRTDTLDLTLSKPFVVGTSYRMTPFVAVQALFVSAKSGRVDLTPNTDAWAECDSVAGAKPNSRGNAVSCQGAGQGADLASDVVFRSVHNTRARLFAGAELTRDYLTSSLSFGYDLTIPGLRANTPSDADDGPLSRQLSVQLSLGLRY